MRILPRTTTKNVRLYFLRRRLRQRFRLSTRTVTFAIFAAGVPAQASPQSADPPLHIFLAGDTLPVDKNGFPLNPTWRGYGSNGLPDMEDLCGFRVNTAHLERRLLYTTVPRCLSLEERNIVSLNEPTSILSLGAECVTGGKLGEVRGHVNWSPITVTGQTVWNSYSGGIGDGDVNIDLVTPLPNAATTGNKEVHGERAYHTEFYDWETLERIPDQGRGFWRALKDARKDSSMAAHLIDNRFATVTGTYGLDAVHNFGAEIHPVFAMAILLDSTSTITGNVREQWAVMFRSSGSEGDCAQGTLPLLVSNSLEDPQFFIIDVGSWPGAGEPLVGLEDSWISDTSYVPKVILADDATKIRNHVYLAFPHPRPAPGSQDFAFLGTISVEWSRPSTEWRRRFSKSLPPDAQVLHIEKYAVAMCSLPKSEESARAQGDESSGEKRTPEDSPAYLGCLPARDRLEIASIQLIQEKSVRVYRNAPWPLVAATRSHCDRIAERSDPLCLSSRSWMLGVSGKCLCKNLFPMGGYYIYPHSVFVSRDGWFWDILRSFGYRLDLRRDQFFPESKRDSLRISGPKQTGYSIRGSAMISPNIVRVEPVEFMPYTIANFGGSRLYHDGWQPTWGWGLGFQTRIRKIDLFAEIQSAIRAGGYVNHWVFSAGWLIGQHR